jgi:hypothetical protein
MHIIIIIIIIIIYLESFDVTFTYILQFYFYILHFANILHLYDLE